MTTTVRSVIRTSLLRAAAVPAFFIAASLAAQQPSEAGVSAAADAFIPTSFQARDVERSRFGSYVAIYHMAEGNSISLYDESLRQVWRTRLAHYWPASVEQGSVIQFAPDESYVLFPGFRSESDICVCDPRSGEPLEVLRGHEETVHVLALSTNGRLLLSASHDELILWERVAGRFVLRDAIRDFGPSVHSAEFLPDGRRVVISTTDDQERAVSVYEIGAQGLRSVFEHSLSDNNITHDIYQLAVSRSGSWFAAGYRESLMIFAVTGDEIRLDQTIEDIDLGVVYSLSFTPDDKHLVSGHFGYLRWWRSSSAGWTESATTSTQLPVANDVEFAADGRTLFVASFADENAVGRYAVSGVDPSPVGVVSSTLGSLSAAQRAVLDERLVERALAALPDGALAARDMFETADEYEHRVERARATISDMVFDAVEERHGAGRRENDAALYDVLVPMDDQGGYDIDRTRYAFTVMGAPAWLRLERDPARSLYRAWQDARVVATRYRTAGVSDYADFRLVHPTSGREYPLVLEQNPFTGERLDTARRFVPAIEVGPDIVLRALELNGIFPTLHARYAEEPLGRFVVENAGTGIVSDLEVSFEIDALTAPDRRVAIAPSIAAGQRIAVELTAPVSPSVLDSSEGGSATLSITVRYRRRNERYERTIVQEIRVLNRNAVRWDDDRRVAAFMNISSAGVLGWSGPVASAAEIDPTPILSRNLLYALQLFESLHAANVRYVVDPNSAYESLSDDRRAVDYLRFPAETIAFGAGDCDDLSVLLATLLESVGVETAYITTPGHILIAFDTGIPVDNALRTFERAEDLIIHDQRAWMPIETTILEEGFTRAWQVAALHWRQHRDAGSAGFFTTREAWSLYAPVAPVLPGTTGTPDIVSTRRRVAEEIDAFRALELEPKLTRARAGRQEQGSPQSRNRIGVLYATYGMPARAAEHFEIAADEGHVPAMVNLANVLSTQGRHDEARIRLESALAAEPENARVLLGLAFSHWESGNEQDARSHYEVASRLSPSLARRYPLFADQPGEAGPGGPAGTRAGVRSNLILTDWVDERTAE